MKSPAKKVLAAATSSEIYWKLSDAEKLVWLLERAYDLGVKVSKPKLPKTKKVKS
jgi:hypothetical protein